MELTVHHFYPDLLNTYGDVGNILALKHRCEKRGITLNINNVSINDNLDLSPSDIIFIGGGQDFEQGIISKDLIKREEVLKEFIENNGTALCICGGYQLFGREYKKSDGETIKGLSILNIETIASSDRKIGNIVIKNEDMGEIFIGFENHSGKTYINNHTPLGKCLLGFGNNGEDMFEGVIYKNLIGTYIHGPFLPKNPYLTDRLISSALKNKYDDFKELKKLDSTYEDKCRDTLFKRFNIKP